MSEEVREDAPKGLIYDKEEDILFFTKGKHSKQTLEVADFILDVDKNNNLVGIELLNASKVLGISKRILDSIKYAKVKIDSTPNSVYLKFLFVALNIQHSVPVPLFPKSSKREPIVSSSWTVYQPIAI